MLFVSTSSRELLLLKEKIRACQIEITYHILNVTLLIIGIRDLGVILGIEWFEVSF